MRTHFEGTIATSGDRLAYFTPQMMMLDAMLVRFTWLTLPIACALLTRLRQRVTIQHGAGIP